MNPRWFTEDVADATRDLVHELLRSGLILSDTIGSLIDSVPDGAYPGEDPAEVVVEMAIGSCMPTVRAAGVRETHRTTALIGAVRDRLIDDLKEAARLAAKRESQA
jgi:hypothetical protein